VQALSAHDRQWNENMSVRESKILAWIWSQMHNIRVLDITRLLYIWPALRTYGEYIIITVLDVTVRLPFVVEPTRDLN